MHDPLVVDTLFAFTEKSDRISWSAATTKVISDIARGIATVRQIQSSSRRSQP